MIKKFLKTRTSELNNITWPTRRQATHAMITVLIIMILVGVFMSAVDYLLQQGVLQLIGT
ncbi:MAG TPA: preprotein translocase subunit SecE [Candidatus Gracilibacteria bacterium]